MADVRQCDLAIVGTGFAGLCMAKTYLQINPSASVVLLDKAKSIGGTWAGERLYPSLRTNNAFGAFEFGDFPMTYDATADSKHIPGRVVNSYLQAYADKFKLTERAILESEVEVAEIQPDSSWMITVATTNAERQQWTLHAARLVVATGQTSQPVVPKISGEADFDGPLFHSKFLAAQPLSFWTRKDVVVLGGSKSAWDAAYELAEAGIQVHWVIRKSGSGPCYMAKPKVTPLRIIADRLTHTRFITWLSPAIWGDADGYASVRRVLNHTALGRKIISNFNRNMQRGVLRDCGIESHPETAKLKPWQDIFWIDTRRGILNYEKDIFEHVRAGRINVHIADISHLSPHAVHLAPTSPSTPPIVLPADGLVFATGWEPTPPLRLTRAGADIRAELGLPHLCESPTTHARSLELRADAEILETLPILRAQPSKALEKPSATLEKPPAAPVPTMTPYLLHRFTVPPAHMHSRTIAFAGAFRSSSTAILAQSQALWVSAFFAGSLARDAATKDARADTDARVAYETVLLSRFLRWRHPLGPRLLVPDFFFDALPFNDLLLRDLGLRRWRKGGGGEGGKEWLWWWGWGCWREWTVGYLPRDYEGLVEEWKASRAEVARGGMSTGEVEEMVFQQRAQRVWWVMYLVMCMFMLLMVRRFWVVVLGI